MILKLPFKFSSVQIAILREVLIYYCNHRMTILMNLVGIPPFNHRSKNRTVTNILCHPSFFLVVTVNSTCHSVFIAYYIFYRRVIGLILYCHTIIGESDSDYFVLSTVEKSDFREYFLFSRSPRDGLPIGNVVRGMFLHTVAASGVYA